ncbi:N-formylglutamate amidohydrolase [bacterium]|nr:N-formylglutamate amidohydrolase [bacterium]
MPKRGFQLLFSCEHASNRIPRRFAAVAKRAGKVLKTHRGYDPGTAALARYLARHFDAPLWIGKWSRLLIELNRSPWHPNLWSEFSKDLSTSEKADLIASYYAPYRSGIETAIKRCLASTHSVLHISLHSFTPMLNGERRRADVGFLYDPRRIREKQFCRAWISELSRAESRLTVRRNYPYRGVADGLTTHLRRLLPDGRYLGIELEVNQRHPLGNSANWRHLIKTLAMTLEQVINAREK